MEGGSELQRLVGQVVDHKRVAVVMEELQERYAGLYRFKETRMT